LILMPIHYNFISKSQLAQMTGTSSTANGAAYSYMEAFFPVESHSISKKTLGYPTRTSTKADFMAVDKVAPTSASFKPYSDLINTLYPGLIS